MGLCKGGKPSGSGPNSQSSSKSSTPRGGTPRGGGRNSGHGNTPRGGTPGGGTPRGGGAGGGAPAPQNTARGKEPEKPAVGSNTSSQSTTPRGSSKDERETEKAAEPRFQGVRLLNKRIFELRMGNEEEPQNVGETSNAQEEPQNVGETSNAQGEPQNVGETSDAQEEPQNVGETSNAQGEPPDVGETSTVQKGKRPDVGETRIAQKNPQDVGETSNTQRSSQDDEGSPSSSLGGVDTLTLKERTEEKKKKLEIFRDSDEGKAFTEMLRRSLVNCLRIEPGNDPRGDGHLKAIMEDLMIYLRFNRGKDSILPGRKRYRQRNNRHATNITINKEKDAYICTNHFRMHFDNRNIQYKFYNVFFRYPGNRKLSPDDKMLLWDTLKVKRKDLFKTPTAVYQGGGILLSGGDFGSGNEKIVLDNSTTIEITFREDIDLGSVETYKNGDGEFPQTAIQALNMIMKEYYRQLNYVAVGRIFFDNINAVPNNALQFLRQLKGYFQSVRLLDIGLTVNVDVMSSAFYQSGITLDQVMQHLLNYKYVTLQQRQHFPPKQQDVTPLFTQSFESQAAVANEHLKSLRIQSNHRQHLQRSERSQSFFSISAVTNQKAANQEVQCYFDEIGEHKRLIRFMKEDYKFPNERLLKPDYPAIKVNKRNDYFIPWGCCRTSDRSLFSGKLNTAAVLSMQRDVFARYEDISKWSNRYAEEQERHIWAEPDYGVRVEKVMQVVPTLKIALPKIEGGHNMEVKWTNEKGFFPDFFAMPAQIAGVLGVLSFGPGSNEGNLKQEQDFLQALAERATFRGMGWPPGGQCRVAVDSTGSYRKKRQAVKDLVQRFKEDSQDMEVGLIVCFMPYKMNPEYATLKYHCDKVLGVPSQVILRKTNMLTNTLVMDNLLLKINVKCGGENFKLTREMMNELPLMTESSTILLGADVSHPANLPSVAAVVATIDKSAVKYACRLRAQSRSKQEMMKDVIKDMVKELLQLWKTTNGGQWPDNIIFFRDGVSETQILSSLRFEGTAILQALEELNIPSANLVIVLAIKRHHHRFFLCRASGKDGSSVKVKNLEAGTLVNTVVTHALQYDFFLFSHMSVGEKTSRPTRYHVILDQIDVEAAVMYKLVFYLCHTYQRTTRSVSLVTPVYYAHLAAFRAKLYIEYLADEAHEQGRPMEAPDHMTLQPKENLQDRLWFV